MVCAISGGHKVRPYVRTWYLGDICAICFIRADIKSAPTRVLVILATFVPYAPLVRRGRPCVGPVYPGNTRSFAKFGQIVIISGGHVPFRADIKSAPTCIFKTLKPLMPYAPLVRRGRPCVGPVYSINIWSFVTFGQIITISGGHKVRPYVLKTERDTPVSIF